MTLDGWVWRLRGQVSELISEGHSDAPYYPVAFIWEEMALVVERKNRELANQGVIMHSAINTAVAAFGKGASKAHSTFKRMIKSLNGDANPDPTPTDQGDK